MKARVGENLPRAARKQGPKLGATTLEASPRGGMRLRCTACGKVAFDTEARAEAAARVSGMDFYLGPCNWWHLARKLRKKRSQSGGEEA